jgi:1,4-dihydroxy-2-naphthoate polyprenyltransferase
MPIFLLGISQIDELNFINSIQVFIILHLLIFPSSNGYNSYMDRDTGSIGGVEKPLATSKQLFFVSIFLDIVGLLWAITINRLFFVCLALYIFASRVYSYRGIRLKKYPLVGYFTVIIFQGALTLFMVLQVCSKNNEIAVNNLLYVVASLLIGGFYPLTQVYQFKQDKADGVYTISQMLGYKGTFIFTATIYTIAAICMFIYFNATEQLQSFYILQGFLLPIFAYFVYWARLVFKNESAANFKNSMRMSAIAAICSNTGFLTIIMIKHFG